MLVTTTTMVLVLMQAHENHRCRWDGDGGEVVIKCDMYEHARRLVYVVRGRISWHDALHGQLAQAGKRLVPSGTRHW